MTTRHLFVGAATAICALVVAHAGLAHGTEPRLETTSERVSRGAPLTVRGYDFSYEDAVDLMLIGGEEDWSIGTADADVEGSFTYTVVLPEAMREGEYVVTARTSHHAVESQPLLVGGLVTSSDADTGRRDQSDALAQPATGTVPSPDTAGVFRVERTSDRDLTPLVLAAVTVLLLGGAVALRRLQGRRDTAS